MPPDMELVIEGKNGGSIMSKEYPHLIETTEPGYTQRTYMVGFCAGDQLTDEEMKVLVESEKYVKEYEIERLMEIWKRAKEDFEKLRDIAGMPEEAIEILKKWTERYGDDEDEDYL